MGFLANFGCEGLGVDVYVTHEMRLTRPNLTSKLQVRTAPRECSGSAAGWFGGGSGEDGGGGSGGGRGRGRGRIVVVVVVVVAAQAIAVVAVVEVVVVVVLSLES